MVSVKTCLYVDPHVRAIVEPTSALDSASCALVEKSLLDELASGESALKAIIWITHSEEQATRVGSRFVTVSGEGGCSEDTLPPV